MKKDKAREESLRLWIVRSHKSSEKLQMFARISQMTSSHEAEKRLRSDETDTVGETSFKN
jgi:hypothetical protein